MAFPDNNKTETGEDVPATGKKKKMGSPKNKEPKHVQINAPKEAYVEVGESPKEVAGVPERMAEFYEKSFFYQTFQPTRERIMSISFDVLEKMTEKNPIVNAIINKRCEQMRTYCKVAQDDRDRGFKIMAMRNAPDAVKADINTITMLENFFLQTGFVYDEDREDDFPDFVQLIVRDQLTFDQNAIELRRTRKGEMYDFWYIDPTTIVRARENKDSDEKFGKGVKYVQLDRDKKVLAEYTDDDIIFDYSTKRSQLKYRGYGYSKAEQCIDMITTLLFSFAYNKDLFQKDRIPKGFLKVMGDVDDKTIGKVRNAWINEMQGYGGRFKVPIVPSGKDGVGLEWESLGQNNRDMEYAKMVNLLISVVCAVYGIDPQEIGIKSENSQPLISNSGDERLQNSKDSGLGSILSYVETICNKILAKISPYHTFQFCGVKDDDRKSETELLTSELNSYRTMDEIREKQGLEPFKQPWSIIPLHPQVIAMINQQKQADLQQQQGMQQQGDGDSQNPFGDNADKNEDSNDDSGEVGDDDVSQMNDEDRGRFDTGEARSKDNGMQKSERAIIEVII